MLFTQFDASSITPLLSGSVVYLVEGEVKYSLAGWQGSICRVAICPRLRPDIPFVSAAWSTFSIFFFFFFRYFLLGSVYSKVFFSRVPNFLFSQQLYCYWPFGYPLQDLQKATTWGDMGGSRRERIVRQIVIFKS